MNSPISSCSLAAVTPFQYVVSIEKRHMLMYCRHLETRQKQFGDRMLCVSLWSQHEIRQKQSHHGEVLSFQLLILKKNSALNAFLFSMSSALTFILYLARALLTVFQRP